MVMCDVAPVNFLSNRVDVTVTVEINVPRCMLYKHVKLTNKEVTYTVRSSTENPLDGR